MIKKILIALATVGLFIVGLTPANAAPSTYVMCDQGLTLREQYPLTGSGVDILHTNNTIGIKTGWGPSPYVTYNGSSMRPVGGMLYGNTNVNPKGGDWCLAVSFKMNDGRYNLVQFNTLQPNQPAIKITGASSYVQDDTGRQVRLGTSLISPGLSDNENHHFILERIGDTFTIKWDDGGQTFSKSVTDPLMGNITFDGVNEPLMIGGKFTDNIAYNVDDMCGIGGTNDAPVLNSCYVWNVQFSWRPAA